MKKVKIENDIKKYETEMISVDFGYVVQQTMERGRGRRVEVEKKVAKCVKWRQISE